MNIQKKKIDNIFNGELALLIFWVLVLTTLNLNSVALNDIDTINYKINLETFFILINYLGYFVPFFLFFIIAYNFYIIKKKNIFSLLYILFGIWQLIVFTIIEQKISNYDNFRLIFNLIIVAIIFNIATTQKYINFYRKSLILIISFISIISSYFVFKLFYEYFSEDTMLYLYSSSTLEAETKTIHQANPRVTGISRMLLILFYFIFFIKIQFKKNKLKQIICIILLFFFSFTIYGMQSRGSILGLGIIILIYLFLVKEKIKKKIITIFMIFILPLITWEAIAFYKINKFNDTKLTNSKLTNSNRIINKPIVDDINDVSSGRSIIWKRAFQIIIDKKIILGLGPQADRKYLIEENIKNEENKYFWQNNSSNAFIYAYLCGGVVGLLLFFSIYFLIIKELYQSIIIKKIFVKSEPHIRFACTTLCYLIIRSLFENSFALFSIDYALCCLSYFILKNNELKNISAN
jgi:oligosaccharide repeat unit polymerase